MIEQIPSDLHEQLRAAHAAESAETTAVNCNAAEIRETEEQFKSVQARLDGKRAKRASLVEAQRIAERKRHDLEDKIIREVLNLELAATILRKQAADPLDNEITLLAEQLRARVPDALDIPIGKEYRVHPVISRALELAPKIPEIYKPNSAAFGMTWPMLRDQIIRNAEKASTETSEPKAA